jgi:hypothetical protein
MEVQIATLCDSAADYNGKLCIMGTFDTLYSRSLPIKQPACALALRMCFKAGDEGKHKLGITIINADGKPAMPPFEPGIEIRLPEDGWFLTRNLVLNMQNLTFEQPGQYSIEISFDGQTVASLPLRVAYVPPQAEQPA